MVAPFKITLQLRRRIRSSNVAWSLIKKKSFPCHGCGAKINMLGRRGGAGWLRLGFAGFFVGGVYYWGGVALVAQGQAVGRGRKKPTFFLWPRKFFFPKPNFPLKGKTIFLFSRAPPHCSRQSPP